jgi:hypothetical protein
MSFTVSQFWLNIKYTPIHAIQKYGPVAQPGRVPDFYHIGRNPAVSGSNPDGPVNYSGSYTSVRNTISIERRLKKEK